MEQNRGFTITELTIVLTLTIIVLGGVITAFTKSLSLMMISDQEIFAVQNAEVSLGLLAREIRQAGYVYGNSVSSPAITTANLDRISFNAVVRDINRDGLIDDTTTWAINVDTETITFDVNNNRVRRTSTNGISPVWLTDQQVEVSSLQFNYFDVAGIPMIPPIPFANLHNIREVRINLTVEKGKEQSNLATSLKPRNL